MTVLIVGAGAAGLTAAFTLLKANITDFAILEASDHVGGRLKKLDKGFASFPIDLGGEWIHVDPTVLNRIAQDNSTLDSIPTILHVPEEYLVYQGPAAGGFTEDLMDLATPDNFTDTLFVNYTWFEFFNDTIALPVTTIKYDSSNQTTAAFDEGTVVATCANGDTYEGSQILVTASVGVLQEGLITFAPELPQDYVEALEAIPMLLGYKMFFKFKQDFYPDIFESKVYPWDKTFGEQKVQGEHIMGVLVHDPKQEEVDLNQTVLLEYTLKILDEMFDGNATKHLLDSVVQNWAQEPFALCSYSLYNDTDWAIEQFKYPVNATRTTGMPLLFFAGEAFPADFAKEGNGFAHGAALSGQETAQWMMEALGEDDGSGGGNDNDGGAVDGDDDDDVTTITKSGALNPSENKNDNGANTEMSTEENLNVHFSAAAKWLAPISGVAYSMLILVLWCY